MNVAQHLYVWRCVPQRPPACGNAARFAHLSLLGSDPVAYQVEVERSRHEREIKTLEDKFASEVAAAKDAARREMIAEVASVRRELIAARSEAEQLRAANADLQRKLQDNEAAMRSIAILLPPNSLMTRRGPVHGPAAYNSAVACRLELALSYCFIKMPKFPRRLPGPPFNTGHVGPR